MAKNWKLKTEITSEIPQNLGQYPKFFQQLLHNRGLVEKDEIEDFLNPKYENLHSPFLFKDMQKAVDRIWQAIEENQKITIYGDYDADAVTANAVLQQTYKYLGVEASSYIPDRFTEGYGVNMEALAKIRDSGSKIIITVDCGTNSIDAAEFCAANNIDLIITDHHEIIGNAPNAYALINPKNPSDNYPYSEITGVGVAFKLACGILSQKDKVSSRFEPPPPASLPKGEGGRKAIDGYEKWLLDLVAIGTVADCHSLLGENRVLVKYGLKVLAKTKWQGLKALMALAKVDIAKPLDAYTLGFIIAPRLNAAGRLEHADTALSLLMETNHEKASTKAIELEAINKRRQDLTARIVSEAREQAELMGDRKILVLANEEWHKGVVGLVAGRLADEFYKPVIILEKTLEFSTGSARTVGDFDIIAALKHSSEHLVRFGGHKQAAGLTLETGKMEIFYQSILNYADINIKEKSSAVLELESELEASDLTPTSYQLQASLEPFGVGNLKPKFLISAMQIISMRQVGASKQHSQLQMQKGDKTISAIAFNSAYIEKNFKVGDTVDVAGELKMDEWNGRKELKLRIIELRSSIARIQV